MLPDEYIVGLVDGEGCFYVNVRPQRPHTKKPHVETHFYVKLAESDRHLLQKLKTTFGCGEIYIQRDSRKNHKTCYRYEVNTRRDINEVVIPFFEKNPLRSQKQKDFEVFRDVASIISRNEHKTFKGLEKVQQLKAKMNIGARRVREIRSLGGNSEQLQLPKSARQVT